MSELEKMKSCSKCKKEKDMSCFVSYIGKETKRCDRCRDMAKKSYNKNKCEHNKEKHRCKDCKGVSICEHNKEKRLCRECKGSAFCKHNKEKRLCRECKGSAFCKHNRRKHICKECGGSAICKHNKQKRQCKECKGNAYCKHNKLKYQCRECKGGSICKHNKHKHSCKICNPIEHLAYCVRSRVNSALKAKKSKGSIEYLGCSIEEYKKHIEEQFQEGMTWDNHGEWHIDHIIPLQYENPSIEEVVERLHYKNTQPLWAEENLKKGNRYIG